MPNAPIIQPSSGGGLTIGGTVTGGTAGSVLIIDGSGGLGQSTTFWWDNTNSRLFIGAHATPPTNSSALTIAPSAYISAVVLAGKAQNNSTDTEGIRMLMFNNSSANRQMMLTDSAYPVSNDTSTHCALRVAILSGTGLIDCVSTDASTGATLNIGNVGSVTQLYGTGISINSSGANPNASAMLDVASTTKGFLPPRLTTTQKNAVSSPATGLVVYDSSLNKLSVYTGAAWETVTSV